MGDPAGAQSICAPVFSRERHTATGVEHKSREFRSAMHMLGKF